MLTILFKILGILGILLLVLLGIALTVILLVLFFPLCYKASGQKSADEMRFSVKVRWLFGLVRIFYNYPQPGKLLAKILFFTVYDSSDERKEKKHVSTGKSGCWLFKFLKNGLNFLYTLSWNTRPVQVKHHFIALIQYCRSRSKLMS